jgi:2-aminoadipate transaminase
MPVISLARGVPSTDLLPAAELADCARAAIEGDPSVLGYGPAGGYAPLREWIAARHDVAPGRVLVTNGSLQGFLFVAQALAERGRVVVEAPTYDRPLRRLLGDFGAEVSTVPVDEDGLDVDALEQELERGLPGFLYVIPTFQNPSGQTLSLARRERLAGLAADGLLVFEDDPYGLVRFEGEPLPTILELTGGRNVIYASSFSKTVAPGARVGYLVLPDELVGAVGELAVSTYISPAILGQATVLEFFRRGLFESNLVRVGAGLRERRDAMLAALERAAPDGATWSRPEGGYFIWLDLPGTDTGELLSRATEAGVTFVPGRDFFLPGEGGAASIRLAYSAVQPPEIEAGVELLLSLVPEPASA